MIHCLVLVLLNVAMLVVIDKGYWPNKHATATSPRVISIALEDVSAGVDLDDI